MKSIFFFSTSFLVFTLFLFAFLFLTKQASAITCYGPATYVCFYSSVGIPSRCSSSGVAGGMCSGGCGVAAGAGICHRCQDTWTCVTPRCDGAGSDACTRRYYTCGSSVGSCNLSAATPNSSACYGTGICPSPTPRPTTPPVYTCTNTSGQYCSPDPCSDAGDVAGSGTCSSGRRCCRIVNTPTPTRRPTPTPNTCTRDCSNTYWCDNNCDYWRTVRSCPANTCVRGSTKLYDNNYRCDGVGGLNCPIPNPTATPRPVTPTPRPTTPPSACDFTTPERRMVDGCTYQTCRSPSPGSWGPNQTCPANTRLVAVANAFKYSCQASAGSCTNPTCTYSQCEGSPLTCVTRTQNAPCPALNCNGCSGPSACIP